MCMKAKKQEENRMLDGKIFGRYVLSYLYVWQCRDSNVNEVTYRPKNRTRLTNGVVFFREGHAVVRELDSGRVLHVEPGDLLLIPTDVAYTITWERGARLHDLANFLFDYDCRIPFHSELGVTNYDTINRSRRNTLPAFLPNGSVTLLHTGEAAERLRSVFGKLYEAYNSTDDYTAFTINEWFYKLIDCVHDLLYPSGESGVGREIDRARLYIEAHCTEALPVAELSKRFSMDRSYFSRRFRETVGVPPAEYKMLCRINLAKELLGGTERPVCEIAELLGFSSDAHFRESFRAAVGISPMQYRKANRSDGAK